MNARGGYNTFQMPKVAYLMCVHVNIHLMGIFVCPHSRISRRTNRTLLYEDRRVRAPKERCTAIRTLTELWRVCGFTRGAAVGAAGGWERAERLHDPIDWIAGNERTLTVRRLAT